METFSKIVLIKDLKRFEKFIKNITPKFFKNIMYNNFKLFLRILRTFCIIKKCNCFEKLFNFEICLKIRILLKNLIIIKTILKPLKEIYQNL